MDYKTFEESNLHSRRSVEHLINLLRNRVDATPPFMFFLGAGASVTSRVRAAATLMEEWRRTQYAAVGAGEPYEGWLKHQTWFEAEDEYSQLFELVYDQPSQRRAFIENVVKSGRPSWGYAFLASLIEHGVVNTAFTTNFDDLINEACYQFGRKLRPLVCAHDSAVNSIRLVSQRPKIVKLHGDFLYDSIKNTSSELSSLETNMRDKLTEFAREFGMIVVGYAGGDKSVMDVLSVLARSPSYFRNGIYWCVRRESLPGPRLRQLLRNERIYWIEIDGFDELMAAIANGLGLSLPIGVSQPYRVALDRCSHLFVDDCIGVHPAIQNARNSVREMHTKVCDLLSSKGLLDAPDLERKAAGGEATRDLEQFAIPFLRADTAINAGDFTEGESILRTMVEKTRSRQRWIARHKLINCLLDSGPRSDDIRAILTTIELGEGSSDDLASCAAYALFFNDLELAAGFVQQALLMNPGCVLAQVNKGLTHLQRGDSQQLAEVAETLVAPRMDARIRAAGFAMRGDLRSLIAPLQRAFALGDYTPKAAMREVVFRPYWGLEEFQHAIRQFAADASVDAPRLANYPMSERERELLSAVRRSFDDAPARIRAV